MLLILFSSFYAVAWARFTSNGLPYDDIGTEWSKNPSLAISNDSWDIRIWNWAIGTSNIYHGDTNNYVKWNQDGLVESNAQDGLDGLWKAVEFDQGQERYENEIPDLGAYAWNNRTSSLAVEGSVTLFDGIGFTGDTITFTGDVSNLVSYGWNDRVCSLKLTQGSRVTLYTDVGYSGGSKSFAYPSYQPTPLKVSDKSSITLEAVVDNWYTSTFTSPGWTGIKFDVYATEDPYSPSAKTLMLELYFVRDGDNLAWGSSWFRPPLADNTYNVLMALDSWPQYAQRTVYPGNVTKWKIDVKGIIQMACNNNWWPYSNLDINKLSIVKIGFTVEAAYNLPMLFNPAAGCSLNRLRLAYTEANTVYLENAYNKPQSGNSWSRVDDPSSFSGAVMEADISSPNGGTLFGPYITQGWDGSDMAGKPYTAAFRLKVSSDLLNDNVAYLDVCYNQGITIRSIEVRGSDFASPYSWQTFELPFTVPSNMIQGIEFRISNLNNQVADLFVDEIAVHRDWDSSTIYFEGAINKPQSGSSWSIINDPSAYYGQVREALSSAQNLGCLYGPYITRGLDGTDLSSAPLIVSFRLKVSSNVSNQVVAGIDVTFNAGTILQSMQVTADDFASPNKWQEFRMSFIAPDSLVVGLEFRVFNLNNGVTNLFVDRVSVAKDVSIVYSQSARDKPRTSNTWSSWDDATSLSGTVLRAPSGSSNGDMLYGPYIKVDKYGASLFGMPYTATYRMKSLFSNVQTDEIVYIDVCYDQGKILQQAFVKASDFVSSGNWQNFQLSFTVPTSLTDGLEFRVQNLNHGIADIFIDKITLSRDWNTSTVYCQSAYNKPQSGNCWTTIVDSSSSSGIVMKANASSQNGDWLYGPYITSGWNGQTLAMRQCTVVFRLKVASNISETVVVYVDVAYNLGSVIQSKMIRASDFTSSDTWQGFQLTFTVPENITQGLEFRVQNSNYAVTDVYADTITVN